jgi:hypothetical protein
MWVGILLFGLNAQALVLEPYVPAEEIPLSVEFTSNLTSVEKVDFLVTVAELESVGFKNVVKLSPSGTRFFLPTQYFRVQEVNNSTTSLQDCEDCSSLLAVYTTPIIATGTPQWVKDQNPFIEKINGRMRAKTFVAGRVLFVNSPENSALQIFMQHMRQRIILNKTS